jgi:ribosomal protein S18 acetylase RimI-like enzyme
MKVRPATAEDSIAIAAVGRLAFSAAFSDLFPDDVLERYLESEYSAGALRRSLAMDGNHYWVAERDSVFGFIKLRANYPHPQLRYLRQWQIDKLYVDPGESGRGCGTRLLATGEEYLRTKAGDCVWLLVYQGNHRAMAFYRRRGYAEGGTDFIAVEDVKIPFKLLLKTAVAARVGTDAPHGGGTGW